MKIKLELDCYELSCIYESLYLAIIHGAQGLEQVFEKIANALEKCSEDNKIQEQ